MQYYLEAHNIAQKLTPPAKKKTLFVALLAVCVAPLEYVNQLLISLVAQERHELKHNGQVICLEQILNLTFPHQHPIFISDSIDQLSDDYYYTNSELEPDLVYIYTTAESTTDELYIYTNQEYQNIDDFVIWIHQDLYDDMDAAGQIPQLHTIVGRRKISGKKYSIKTYTI